MRKLIAAPRVPPSRLEFVTAHPSAAQLGLPAKAHADCSYTLRLRTYYIGRRNSASQDRHGESQQGGECVNGRSGQEHGREAPKAQRITRWVRDHPMQKS